MECVAPSAKGWRAQEHNWNYDDTAGKLRLAWGRDSRPGPPYNYMHHDWMNFRTATLRRARRLGLDLSVVPAKTLGT